MQKKILSFFLAIAMMLCTLPAMAEEAVAVSEETAALTTQEVAPEEQPEVLEGTLLKAVNLLSALSIAKGYEDGTFRPENQVTRAEYAAFVARMLRGGMVEATDNAGAVREVVKEIVTEKVVEIPATEEGAAPTTEIVKETTYEVEYVSAEVMATQPSFNDVAANHWANSDITFLRDLGIVSGMGDGSFAPDAPVSFQDAVKMTLCALGSYYGDYAMANGGYPLGYIVKASELGLLKELENRGAEAILRGEVAVLLYNALSAEYLVFDQIKDGRPDYKTDETILSYVFDIDKTNGYVTANMYSTLAGPNEGAKENEIEIDGVRYRAIDETSQNYLGYYVTAYVKADDDDDSLGTMYMMVPHVKSKEVMVEADDIEKATASRLDVVVNDESESYSIDAKTVIYNGTAYTDDFKQNAEALLMPSYGYVKLVSTKGATEYDLVIIENIEHQIVRSVNKKEQKLYFMDNSYYDLDVENNEELRVVLTKNGANATLDTDFAADDIVAIVKSGNLIRIENLGPNVVSGKLAGKGKKSVIVNDVTYEITASAADMVKIGKAYKLYLTKANEVFFAKEISLTELEANMLTYGLLLHVGNSSSSALSSGYLNIKLFGVDGQMKFLNSTDDMKFNNLRIGKKDAQGVKTTAESIIAELKTTTMELAKSNTVSVKNENGTTANVQNPFLQVVKYKVNAEGLVTELYSSAYNDPDVFKKYGVYTGKIITNGILQSTPYSLSGTMVFSVPNWKNPLESDYKILKGVNSRDTDLDDYIIYDINKDLNVGVAVTHVPKSAGASINLASVMKYFIEAEEAQATKAGQSEPVDGAMLYFYDTGSKKSVFVEKSNSAYATAMRLQPGDCFYYSTTNPDGFLNDFNNKIWTIDSIVKNIQNTQNGTYMQILDALNSTTSFYQFMFNVARIVSVDGDELVLSTHATSDDLTYQFCTSLGKAVYKYDAKEKEITTGETKDFDPGEYVVLRRNSYQFGDIMLIEGLN